MTQPKRPSSTLEEVRFWAQVIKDSERTIVCNPDVESRIVTGLKARGLNPTVKATPMCPSGVAYVVDENALDADFRQWTGGLSLFGKGSQP